MYYIVLIYLGERAREIVDDDMRSKRYVPSLSSHVVDEISCFCLLMIVEN